MAKFGRGRMPHLGSECPDDCGLDLIEQWIASLGEPADASGPAAADRRRASRRRSSRLDTALPFARAVGDAEARRRDRGAILAAAAKLEPGPVRDLFEGYLPPDPKGRKLGTNPRPASILALAGDAKKGEALFFDKDMKCANCHKVGDRAPPSARTSPPSARPARGPNCSKACWNRRRASSRSSPRTSSGRRTRRRVTGLLVKRDEKQVVLRDAENKETCSRRRTWSACGRRGCR